MTITDPTVHVNTFSVCVFVCVHRPGWAGGRAAVCLLGDPAFSAAALLLLQDQDFLLP